MKFAINYSLPAAALAREHRIEVDLFKCPDWPEVISAASNDLPIYVHFGFRAGAGNLDTVDWANVQRLMDQTNTPYVNLHLYPRIADFVGEAFEPAQPPQVDEAHVIEQVLNDVEIASKHMGAERVIIENVPYPDFVSVIPPCAASLEVIRRVLDESGCGFLLDLSHARVAARSQHMDEFEYINNLPVDRLRELHITGLKRIDGGWRDHMEMSEQDWPVLEWALANIRAGRWVEPWVVTFEYGGVTPAWPVDEEILATQARRMSQWICAR